MSCDLPDAPLGRIGRSVLASIFNRSSFLVGDLLLGKLGGTVVVGSKSKGATRSYTTRTCAKPLLDQSRILGLPRQKLLELAIILNHMPLDTNQWIGPEVWAHAGGRIQSEARRYRAGARGR